MQFRNYLARTLCVAILIVTGITITQHHSASHQRSDHLELAAAVSPLSSPGHVFSPHFPLTPGAATATVLGSPKETSAAVNPYAVNEALRFIRTRLWNDTLLVHEVDLYNRTVRWNKAVNDARARATTVVRHMSSSPAYVGSVSGTGSVNGMPCGGSLPSCCTLQKESGGTPTAQNPSSSASGLWQFLDSTWNGYGGYGRAADAPVDVQNARAAQVFAGGAGASNWYGDGCYNGR